MRHVISVALRRCGDSRTSSDAAWTTDGLRVPSSSYLTLDQGGQGRAYTVRPYCEGLDGLDAELASGPLGK